MRRPLLALTLTLLTLFWPSPALGQGSPRIAQVTVSLWPEFDRPEVLVIYRIQLAGDTALPTQASVPLPADVTTLNAVATRSDDGTLVNAQYTEETADQGTQLVIQSDSLEIQVEFYTPIDRAGTLRSFTFTWPGGLAVDRFTYDFQEPVGAADLTLTPPASSRAVGEFGLTYHRVDAGAIDVTGKPSLAVSYTRTTDQLTSDFLGNQTPLGTPAAPGGRTPDLARYLPYALLGLGVLLLAGGGFYYLRSVRAERSPRPRHRRAAAETEELDASPVYCHNCGARASASDRFCRQCGTPLRR